MYYINGKAGIIMRIRLNKLTNIMFYLSYFFFLLYAFFGTIEIFRVPLKSLTNISMVIIVISFLIQFKRYNIKDFVIIFLLLMLSIVFVLKTNNYVLMKLILIIIVSKDVNIYDRVSYDFKLRITFLIIMFIFYYLGISEDVIALYNGKIRHSIGFSNPNVLGMHIFILGMDFLYLKIKRLNFSNMLFLLLLFILSYVYSGSRTIVLILFLSIILFLTYKYKKAFFEKRTVRFFIINSPIILSIIVLIAYKLYINNNMIGIYIDKLLSGRLLNISFFDKNYPINFFGSNIAIANKSLDTANAYVLYAFGIFGMTLYIFGFRGLLKKLYDNKNITLLIIMFVFIIYGLSEKLWLFADCNIFITALSILIFNNNCFNKKSGGN